MKSAPCAHRVPHPRRRSADGFGQQVCSAPQVGPHSGGAAVTGGVRKDEGEPALELVHDRGPGTARLGETVQQGERRLGGARDLLHEAGRQRPVLYLSMILGPSTIFGLSLTLGFCVLSGHSGILDQLASTCHSTTGARAAVGSSWPAGLSWPALVGTSAVPGL